MRYSTGSAPSHTKRAIYHPNESARKSERKDIRTKSICSSPIFAISNGTIKPAQTIQLGLVSRSISGRRMLPEILNRLGYAIDYTTIGEIESELAYEAQDANRTLPTSLISNSPTLRTHMAFDNYDRFVETKNGKDTLHDTVGIVIQNISNT